MFYHSKVRIVSNFYAKSSILKPFNDIKNISTSHSQWFSMLLPLPMPPSPPMPPMPIPTGLIRISVMIPCPSDIFLDASPKNPTSPRKKNRWWRNPPPGNEGLESRRNWRRIWIKPQHLKTLNSRPKTAYDGTAFGRVLTENDAQGYRKKEEKMTGRLRMDKKKDEG